MDERQRPLEGDASPARTSPVADREDTLSPARSLRESVAESGSQRIGNNEAVANPRTSFPDNQEVERRAGADG
jgi:hypothetical protein